MAKEDESESHKTKTNLSFFTLCFGHRSEKLSSFREQSGRGTRTFSKTEAPPHTAWTLRTIVAFKNKHKHLLLFNWI